MGVAANLEGSEVPKGTLGLQHIVGCLQQWSVSPMCGGVHLCDCGCPLKVQSHQLHFIKVRALGREQNSTHGLLVLPPTVCSSGGVGSAVVWGKIMPVPSCMHNAMSRDCAHLCTIRERLPHQCGSWMPKAPPPMWEPCKFKWTAEHSGQSQV